jgi:predicted short-subunit dehydrogenase-like oxidoreductase (DUF2520 family)
MEERRTGGLTEDEAPRKRVLVVGAGRVGTAIAGALQKAGYRIVGVCDPSDEAKRRAADILGAGSREAVEAVEEADVVLITTPDSTIEAACREIAESGGDISGKKFVHMSGALSTAALEPAAERGADVLSIHPLQTFPDVEAALRFLPGSRFGVTCDDEVREWAERFVGDLGGESIVVQDEQKALYHAAAVIACNLFTMLQHACQYLCRELGFEEETARRAFMPLAAAALRNLEVMGPVDALTGPLSRGDAGTVSSHLRALYGVDPELATLYAAVSEWGLRLVRERGDVPREEIEKMRSILAEHLGGCRTAES